MRKFVSKISLLLASVAMIYSCQNNDGPAIEETYQTIAFDADAQNEDEGFTITDLESGSTTRALSFDHEAIQGKDYPKPVLKLSDGERVPVIFILQRESNPNTRVIAESQFTFRLKGKTLKDPIVQGPKVLSTEGSLLASGNISIPTSAGLSTSQTDWKVLAIVGGRLLNHTDGKQYVTFDSNSTTEVLDNDDAQSNKMRSLETIYMNEEWTDVGVASSPTKGLSMYAKNTIKLKNQGVIFMVRAVNGFDRPIDLRGFHVAAQNIAFYGNYNLTDMTFGQKPKFAASGRKDGHRFNIRSKKNGAAQLQNIQPDATSKFIVFVGIPTVATTMQADPKDPKKKISKPFTTSMHVSSLLGANYEVEGKTNVFTDKSVSHGSFISVKTVEIAQRDLRHPIESFMYDNETGIIFRKEDPNFFQAVSDADNAAVQELGDEGRNFHLPSEDHLRILFPNMREGETTTNLGAGSVPILNMNQDGIGQNNKPKWETETQKAYVIPKIILAERIRAWGSTGDFHADYKMTIKGKTKPAYGLRFKGSMHYRSAYRYQVKIQNDGSKLLEIRVRYMTSPKYKNWNIDWIASEEWWNTPLPWNEREIVRYVKRGRYWSNTKYKRASAPKGAVSVAKVMLEDTDDLQTTYPYGAFVTDSRRRGWMENPIEKSNWVNSGFTLVTDSKTAAQ